MEETSRVTFETLRQANMWRLPEFKNALGGPAHSEPDGSDRLGDFTTASWRRGRGVTVPESLNAVAAELAVLAYAWEIDLGAAVIAKFNRVSLRVGSTVRISDDGAFRVDVP